MASSSETTKTVIWPANVISQASFCDLVWREGKRRYRDLPWRNTSDPYDILVSEIMLQQTQVSRVQGRWERFMGKFPTLDALAAVASSDVLEEWQGLGYNRRALALKRLAEYCSKNYQGTLPDSFDELIKLPGIGPSTAGGVLAFAHDMPCVYLETNVRTVYLYHLFPDETSVSDRQIAPLVQLSCPHTDVRNWYYALLDYGTYLKSTVGNASRKSAHYTKQSRFEGSRRQKRATLVRIVLANPGILIDDALDQLNQSEQTSGRSAVSPTDYELIVDGLVKDGFFSIDEGRLIP